MGKSKTSVKNTSKYTHCVLSEKILNIARDFHTHSRALYKGCVGFEEFKDSSITAMWYVPVSSFTSQGDSLTDGEGFFLDLCFDQENFNVAIQPGSFGSTPDTFSNTDSKKITPVITIKISDALNTYNKKSNTSYNNIYEALENHNNHNSGNHFSACDDNPISCFIDLEKKRHAKLGNDGNELYIHQICISPAYSPAVDVQSMPMLGSLYLTNKKDKIDGDITNRIRDAANEIGDILFKYILDHFLNLNHEIFLKNINSSLWNEMMNNAGENNHHFNYRNWHALAFCLPLLFPVDYVVIKGVIQKDLLFKKNDQGLLLNPICRKLKINPKFSTDLFELLKISISAVLATKLLSNLKVAPCEKSIELGANHLAGFYLSSYRDFEIVWIGSHGRKSSIESCYLLSQLDDVHSAVLSLTRLRNFKKNCYLTAIYEIPLINFDDSLSIKLCSIKALNRPNNLICDRNELTSNQKFLFLASMVHLALLQPKQGKRHHAAY